MDKIIKDGGLVDDLWSLLDESDTELLQRNKSACYIMPFSQWLSHQESFEHCPGVWIEASDELEPLAPYLDRIPLIAIRFPAFVDGSGFSTGALLREAMGFEGELRAIGNLMVDQVPMLRRCGFNAFSLASIEQLELALQLLVSSQLSYQGSIYSPRTPFKFRYLKGGKSHA